MLFAWVLASALMTFASAQDCETTYSSKFFQIIPDPGFNFASYYQNNMVLQASPLRSILWGYGQYLAVVEVNVNVKTSYITIVNRTVDGRAAWSLVLDPMPPGTRATISASHLYGGMLHVIRISNVIFGDVWVCSGQSNMMFPVGHMFNASDERDKVSRYPDVRIFSVARNTSVKPMYDLPGVAQSWKSPNAEIVQYFSAVCWLYGRNLFDKLKRPIGLISSDWVATPVEVWSSANALSHCDVEDLEFYRYISELNLPPRANSVLWNAMIHPLLNMTIKGVIWYQGEENAQYHRDIYNCTFPAMIKEWRQAWNAGTDSETEGEFPFGFVQLCGDVNNNNTFAITRWHQTADYGYVPNDKMPNTFMAVTIDLPDPQSPYGPIHSRYKLDVGLRLAKAALSQVYQFEMTDPGPFPVSAVLQYDVIIVKYPLANLQLRSYNNFQLCCSSNSCDVSNVTAKADEEWLDAPVLDHDVSTIYLGGIKACPGNVKKIRYGWASSPCEFKKCATYNEHDMPGPPFVMDVMSDFLPIDERSKGI